MEEKKSSNQVIGNGERDFQFSVGAAENASHAKVKLYGRDFLLQLRLHPLSLQKPKSLPNMEVVREKLYLHDINETCSPSADHSLDNNNASLKSEYCNMKHEYPLLPHYINRQYPYCFVPPHGYNGYQGASSKFRPPFHSYCNPLKKHCAVSHQCYKDFPMEECLWTKRCFPSTEEMWNCYPNFIKKNEHLEAIPKCKKKLPIIDPVTGKNVLETVTAVQDEQSDTYPENSESSECCYSVISDEKFTEEYLCNGKGNGGHSEISNESYDNSVACSSEDKTYDKIKQLCEDNVYKKVEDNSNPHETSSVIPNNKKAENPHFASKDGTTTTEFATLQESMHESIKNSENVDENSDTSKTENKKVAKICQNRENYHTDKHSCCESHHKKDMHTSNESTSKQSDSVKESFKPREKLSLKQEQQRMAILQSFLRYKKYELEENARNLDEKRIEIANWECNLYNKARRLHDKELWLESQSEILFNKAQQLADREKLLNKEENNSSGDCLPSKITKKEPQFPAKKFVLYNCNETAWDEIPIKMKSSYKYDQTNDFSYFGGCTSNSSKVNDDVSSNIEKCKSNGCSLDELESNIVFIEKMHLSGEIQDASLGNKIDTSSSNSAQKKDEIDPLGYSKGRRYLPEHIKYWLNKRDKSAL